MYMISRLLVGNELSARDLDFRVVEVETGTGREGNNILRRERSDKDSSIFSHFFRQKIQIQIILSCV